MDVKLTSIIDAIAFQADESHAFLNKRSGEVEIFSDEEIRVAESNQDVSDQAEWYRNAVARAKFFVENEDDFISLPSKYEFHEYRVMEAFIVALPVEEQREELFRLIRGKGAFSLFRQGLEHKSLKEPRCMRQVPASRTGVGHRLNRTVFGSQGLCESLGETPHVLVLVRQAFR